MSIEIKFKEDVKKVLTFEDVPTNALFVDLEGDLLQKFSRSRAVMIADSNGRLLCGCDINMHHYEEVKKIYDIEKIEFS
jgi:hypothetical protein